jgi:hypothetical protein
MIGLGNRMRQKVKRLINSGGMSSVNVILRWRELSGLAVDFNPEVEGTEGEDYEMEEKFSDPPVKALYHAVTVGQTAYQRNVEIRKGDVILGFPYDVVLAGKKELRFEVNKITYVQRDGGAGICETWDAIVEGVTVINEILVRPVGGVPG